MNTSHAFLEGLIAATYTPMHSDGSINFAAILPMVDHLVQHRIAGMYVLGSTGEGPSLTFDERRAVAESFIEASAGRLPTMVQCGCESLEQARLLAVHAQEAGASAISAVSPVYFKPDSVSTLAESMAHVAAGAPSLPFYYYHIPAVTGVNLSMEEFLRVAGGRIPTLQGIKFTSPNVYEYQSCVEYAQDRFEILWGSDEMLLFGLMAGGRAAVGSTYNYAAPIYHRLLAAFAAGDFSSARQFQSQSQAIVRAFVPYGPRSAQKAIMAMVGVDCGQPRWPVAPLSADSFESLRRDLEAIGFFEQVAVDAVLDAKA